MYFGAKPSRVCFLAIFDQKKKALLNKEGRREILHEELATRGDPTTRVIRLRQS
jgi:hypothetical protein